MRGRFAEALTGLFRQKARLARARAGEDPAGPPPPPLPPGAPAAERLRYLLRARAALPRGLKERPEGEREGG